MSRGTNPITINKQREKTKGPTIQKADALEDRLIAKEHELEEAGKLMGQWMVELKKAKNEVEEIKVVWEVRAKARLGALQEERDNLDKKVKERTKDLEGSQKALFNILEDTEESRKTAEKERNKTKTILTNLIDGLLVLDNNKQISFINPKAKEVLQINNRLLGKRFLELEKIPNVKKLFILLRGDEPQKIFRRELVFDQNAVFEVSVIDMLYKEEELGEIVVLHDITREKLIERMKTEFVSLAAHQLRTPLSAIKWTLKMLLDGDLGGITPEQKNFITKTYS